MLPKQARGTFRKHGFKTCRNAAPDCTADPTRLQAGSAEQYKAMGIATPAQELFTNADPSLLQWGNYTYVIELASRVLERQPDNVKLLYRRGVAHLEKNEFGESKADLGSVQPLSSQFAFQCCNLPQLLNTQKNLPFHLSLHINLEALKMG